MDPIVVFDLDGTLADTADDIVGAVNHVFKVHDVPEFILGGRKWLISSGGRAIISAGLADVGMEVQRDQVEIFFRLFIDYYQEHVAVHSRLYPGAQTALEGLSRDGYKLAICTNKSYGPTTQLLEKFSIQHYFAAVCGNDSLPWTKPDPRALLSTIQLAKGDPKRCVMVGDTKPDVDAARSAGIPVIAVDFGYSDVPVEALHPDLVMSDFAFLRDQVASISRRR